MRAHPRLYEFVFRFFAPVLVTGPEAQEVLADALARGTVADLGSANQRRHARFVNVDIVPYDEVDVVASVARLPFADGSLTGVCCLVTLEHVPDADRVLAEMQRVVAKGGTVFVAVPFLQPYHASPDDYRRWTLRGLRLDLERHGFHVHRAGVYCGPASALAWGIAAGLGHLLSCGSTRVRRAIDLPLQALCSPLKWLDLVLARIPGAAHVSSAVYGVATRT